MERTRKGSGWSRAPILRGTLDMLVLKSVSSTPRHGWAIARWITRASGLELQIDDGSLHPALRRLEERGLLVARWGLSEQNRRARYYRISTAGKRALNSMLSEWAAFSAAISTTLARSALAAARRARTRYGSQR